MSATTTPGTGTAAESLAKRVEKLRAELVAQRKRTNFSAAATLVVGLAVLVLLGGYFWFGYSQFSEVTQPESLVKTVSTYVSDKIPDLRKSSQDYLVNNTPIWAATLSKQAQESVPQGREQLETYILTQFDATLDRGMLMTDEHFKAFLKNNKATIETGLKEMASSSEMAESTVNELVAGIEKEMKASVESQTEELYRTLKSMNAEIKKLREGTNLTEKEQNRRRLLMLFHRAILEHNARPASESTDTAAAPEPAAGAAPTPPAGSADPVGNVGRTKGREKSKD
jgi:hypothetical protein